MNIHKITTRVRYVETDMMGVVYHGNYAIYFEMGRVEWLRNLGVSYKWMEDNGVMLPVVSITMNYKKSAFYDDELVVTTKLKKLSNVKIEFEYEIHNQNDELLTTGETTLVFVDKNTGRPIKAPTYISDKIKT